MEDISEKLSHYYSQSNSSPLLYLVVASVGMGDSFHAVGVQLDEKNNRFRYFDDNYGIFEFSSKEELLSMVPKLIHYCYGEGLYHFAGQGANPLPSKLREPSLARYQELSAQITRLESDLADLEELPKIKLDNGELIGDSRRDALANRLDELEREREEVGVKLIQMYGEEKGENCLRDALKIAEKAHPASKIVGQFQRSFKLSVFAAKRRLGQV